MKPSAQHRAHQPSATRVRGINAVRNRDSAFQPTERTNVGWIQPLHLLQASGSQQRRCNNVGVNNVKERVVRPWVRRSDDEVGEDPDARFTFANERTFLAWNRTALGCIVAGLAVSHVLEPEDGSDFGPTLAGVVLMTLGGLLALFSYTNWSAAQRALRLGQQLPSSRLPMVLSVVTTIVAAVTIVYTLA
jgi:putative membrane protein